MMMSPQEEHCRITFNELLLKQGLNPIWAAGTEPPDYFLNLGSHRIAVEVTSIHGITTLNERPYSQTQLSKVLLGFGEEVAATIESKVDFLGCFCVTLPAIPHLNKWKDKILQALISYFENESLCAKEMRSTVILRPEGKSVSVMKIKNDGKSIIPQALPAGAFITANTDNLTDLLNVAIKTKSSKLRNVPQPWVLIIHDYYGFQRALTEWQERLPTESRLFEAIIRVRQNKAEYIKGEITI